MTRALLRWHKLPVRVTREHKAALARALESRYRKLVKGMLYNAEGQRPKDFAEGISVDLGFVLIGLVECLGSRRAAEDTLKDIIALFLYSFDPPTEDRRLIDSKKFSLNREFEMVRVWNAFGVERRLEAVLSVGARWLFGADADAASIAQLLAPDARQIYVRTLHVFGQTLQSGPTTASLAETR
jgi:hypothetical protein